MLTALLSRIIILIFAVLHPAYKSYKSLKNKNQLEIVTWIMYWIVFALYTAVETVTDLFLSWVPFYYEIKIFFILWMSLPVTRGYSIIFRKIIHPELQKREPEIDEIIEKVSEKGYNTLINFGAKGINFAATTVVSTAVRGQEFLATRSLSMGDLSLSHSKASFNEPTADELDHTFDVFDTAISGQGDYSTSPAPRLRKNKRGYDTGTFPKRRPKTMDLQMLPEEELSIITDLEQENKKDKSKTSQVTAVENSDEEVILFPEQYSVKTRRRNRKL